MVKFFVVEKIHHASKLQISTFRKVFRERENEHRAEIKRSEMRIGVPKFYRE